MEFKPLSGRCGVVLDANGTDLDSVDVDAVIKTFRDNGAVLFRGFGAEPRDFEEFSDRFSGDYMDNEGSGSYRLTVNPETDGTIQNTAYVFGTDQQRTFGLPLHADRSYVKTQPVILWFFCAHKAAANGETLLCDGVHIHNNLSDKVRTFFTDNPIKYVRHYSQEEWQVLYHTEDLQKVEAYCEANEMTLKVNDDRSIDTEFVKSAIVETRWGGHRAFVNSILIVQWQEDELGLTRSLVRMADGSRIPGEMLAEVKQVSAAETLELPWNNGDFAIIDNTRMMHGRRAFEDQKRAVFIRMCQSVDW